MFKNIGSLLFVYGVVFTINAQFSIDNDTLLAEGQATEFELVAPAKISNISSNPDTIVWTRTLNDIPSNWTSAICDIIQCYGVTVNTAEFILPANSVKGISFHFYPASNKGKGTMIVRFARKSNPSIFIDILIYSQGYGLNLSNISNSFLSVFPNPASNSITFGNEKMKEGTFEIINVLGEKVMNNTFTTAQKIDISTLPKGIYFITIQDGNSFASSKLVID